MVVKEVQLRQSHEMYVLQPKVKLLIGGELLDSQTKEWIDVINPVSFET
jgi:hypothetical protein